MLSKDFNFHGIIHSLQISLLEKVEKEVQNVSIKHCIFKLYRLLEFREEEDFLNKKLH